MSQINDQNILLKAQLAASGTTHQQQNLTHNGYSSNNNGYDHQQNYARIQELEQQIATLLTEKSHQDTKIKFYESENARLLTDIEQFKAISTNESVISQLNNEKAELNSRIEKMNKDQDDLLELLADQDVKMKEYRKRLKGLGQQVDDDDDED
jgi:chromosome segregation ATPase